MSAIIGGRRIAKLGTLLLLSVLAFSAGADEPQRLGWVFDEDPTLAGGLAGSGREVDSGDLLRAMNTGALVRLDNGQVLRLDPNSAAVLDGGADGEVRVRVLSGRISTVDATGRPLVGGARSSFALPRIVQDEEAVERRLLGLETGRTSRRDDGSEQAGREGRVRLSR